MCSSVKDTDIDVTFLLFDGRFMGFYDEELAHVLGVMGY